MRFVPLPETVPGMISARDIVTRNRVRITAKGMAISKDTIDLMNKLGYLGVYVQDRMSEDVKIDEPVSQKFIAEAVEVLASKNVDKALECAKRILKDMTSESFSSLDLVDLRDFDDYVYRHCINVTIISIAIGKRLHLPDKDLENLAEAAICHDFGKFDLPAAVLNKPGALTDEEYEIIKRHPKLSKDIISISPNVSAVVKQAVLMHHENENGTGYPLGKTGAEIPLIAKIIHVVDVYDALISKRPFKEPYLPSAALEYLSGGKDILFDGKVVDAMHEVMPPYPAGCEVVLSDGRTGLVVGQSFNIKRPLVKLYDDERVLNLDAASNSNLRVRAGASVGIGSQRPVKSLNESRSHSTNQKAKILVVDDMPLSVAQTKAALSEDYEVVTALSALDALSVIQKEGVPDAFIVDVAMPVMDGFSFVKALRAMGIKNNPILFLSSSADKETVLKCASLGATDFMVKPAKPVYIRQRVAYALKEQRE